MYCLRLGTTFPGDRGYHIGQGTLSSSPSAEESKVPRPTATGAIKKQRSSAETAHNKRRLTNNKNQIEVPRNSKEGCQQFNLISDGPCLGRQEPRGIPRERDSPAIGLLGKMSTHKLPVQENQQQRRRTWTALFVQRELCGGPGATTALPYAPRVF